ncbi:IclR family transcriptional regulator [Microbacterium soli]|uniref:IclR family transcriptional regulator n=1 Tax=Microbacterium soli TaxID=446075 RepID=A0ABP7MZG3_9MICO
MVAGAAPTPGKPAGSARTVRAVVHAVQLLRRLAQSTAPSPLGELAESVGLSKPATFNLLKTLELEGLVGKDDDARYRLGWGVYELGSAVVRGADLTRVGRSHLDHLAEVTGEATLLAIIDDSTVLYIDRGQADDSFAMVANVGRRSPLHTNASGKVLLAWKDEAFLDAYLSTTTLERRTARTITDPDVLRAELTKVRQQGFATCVQEQEEGLSSISVPVVGHTGEAVAALTVAAPSPRINDGSMPEIRDLLLSAATEMSVRLGGPAA